MNIVIQEKRKGLGLTQEQVADYLGVSTPAVSKWEKGITSPDIGLLPSLARLLKIDMNMLFSFNEDISPQEIGLFCNELAMMARDNIISAFEFAEAKVHEYPHNEQLLLNTAIILDSMLLQTHSPDVSIDDFEAKISSWYSCLGQSSDESIRNSANYMRVNRYIRQDKLDAAQEILDTMQDKKELVNSLPDKLMLQVSIHLKQGRSELAALELEKALFQETERVHLILSKLLEAELASGETGIAEIIAEKAETMVELFDMWKYTGYTASFQIASQEMDADKMLPLLDKMFEALMSPWHLNDSVLYHRMAPQTKEIQSKELLSLLLKELETDPDCGYLREHPKYKELITKYFEN
ncbi:MAG: helix-turn-helix transcriptional regulator [Lachnospiraceae bacterium]|nr:helix-turn-helix transcriptional regulator [Lachnospiraceae bacterium]